MVRKKTSAIPIAEAEEGAQVTLRGQIRRARPSLLVAPLSERECVAWEIHKSLGDSEPEQAEATDFWLEDESGRVLVRPEGIRMEARAQREEQAVSVVEADIFEVEKKLRALKLEKKRAGGARASSIFGEQKQLRKLATLLYAIRAHAKGRVHVGGTREGQERYIEERSEAMRRSGEAGGHAERSLHMMRERFEIALTEGVEIEAHGICQTGPIPAGIGAGGGYRQRPVCKQLLAPPGGSLLLEGLGVFAPQKAGEPPRPSPRPSRGVHPERPSGTELEDYRRHAGDGTRRVRAVLLLVALGLAGYFWYLLSHP